ncbi:T9SS type A sorting domain-containing protein [Flavobacteriaceae bacterium TK19130]|nr:T9SS type A sorting domain-containing protein [Thermobacterium salinum]
METNITTIFKTILVLIIFNYQGLQSNVLYAQITAIPDSNFEQALIDLDIDSDGIINGQVLTSDIETVITLDISSSGITDLTGIEDFSGLESLDVSSNSLTILNVSNNIQLKELYASNTGTEDLAISSLDLSNNINLEELYGENLFFLENLNLKNGNNSILNVTLLCEEEGIPCELPLTCAMVDDESAATNNEPPYSSWFIEADYIYSEDCSLSVNDDNLAAINVYPNPVGNQLLIDNNKHIKIDKITVSDILGKVVLIEKNIVNQLNLSELKSGILFINFETDNGIITKKIIKE